MHIEIERRRNINGMETEAGNMADDGAYKEGCVLCVVPVAGCRAGLCAWLQHPDRRCQRGGFIVDEPQLYKGR